MLLGPQEGPQGPQNIRGPPVKATEIHNRIERSSTNDMQSVTCAGPIVCSLAFASMIEPVEDGATYRPENMVTKCICASSSVRDPEPGDPRPSAGRLLTT